MLKSLVGRIKLFFAQNPKRAQFITLALLLVAIPFTVIAALTVQNLVQRAGGGDFVQILDANGNSISKTSDPQVFLKITLPADWIATGNQQFSRNSSLVEKTYAQSSCPTITCGTNSGAGGTCLFGDPQEGKNSNVSGCTATCPNGSVVPGFSVSVCQTDNCYNNNCKCYPNPGACDSVSTPTPISTPTPPATGICIPTESISCEPKECDSKGVQRCKTNCDTGPYVYQDLPCTPKSGVGGPSSPSATPAAQRILKNLYIANIDADGSSGGDAPINISSNFAGFLSKPIPWKLNPLIGGQNEAARVVQVTFFDGKDFIPFIATTTLVRTTQSTGTISAVAVSFKCDLTRVSQNSVCHGSATAYDSANFPIFNGVEYEWGISSTNSIGSLEKIQGNITGFVAKNVGTGSLWVIAKQGSNQIKKAVEVTVVSGSLPSTSTGANINDVINQFGRRGNNLSGDVNRDGIVDGTDYNILLRE